MTPGEYGRRLAEQQQAEGHELTDAQVEAIARILASGEEAEAA